MRRITSIVLALSLASLALAQGGGSFGSSPQGAPPAAPTKGEPAAKPSESEAEPRPSGEKPAKEGPASSAPANLPTADEIFKRSVQAIGGEAAIRKHESMHMKGTLSMAAAKMQGSMEMFMLAPNKFLTNIEMAGMGRMAQGFDGTVGWSMNPMMGTQLLEGRTLDELRRSSDFYKELDPGKVWRSAKVVGVNDFAGHRCHEIAVEGDMGDGSLFYGVDDGLARGMRMTVDSPMGKVPTTTRMVEYKPFDGLLIASKTEIEAMGAVQTMTIDSVDFTPVDPKTFELPAEVKALVSSGQKAAPPKAKPGANGAARAVKPKPAPANGG
ncbi:MAG: hypothetical protein ACKPEA_04835, partial [Planctomycetota bacterium]